MQKRSGFCLKWMSVAEDLSPPTCLVTPTVQTLGFL
jgi:hypothetical protein